MFKLSKLQSDLTSALMTSSQVEVLHLLPTILLELWEFMPPILRLFQFMKDLLWLITISLQMMTMMMQQRL